MAIGGQALAHLLRHVQQPLAVAGKIMVLAADPELRRTMGQEGRRIFEQEFTLNAFHRSMERELLGLF